MRRTRLRIVGIATVVMLTAPLLEAQWVWVARKAAQRIRNVRQADAAGNGFDVATVLLEAPAEKVYEAALANVRQHQDVKITRADAATLTVEFTNGKQSASMVATSLGPKATDLLVAVTVSSDPAGTAWRVVDGVMKVCAQMNVDCRVGP
jgi:hypothetical protein